MPSWCVWFTNVRPDINGARNHHQHDRQIVLESFDLGGPVCELGQCSYRKSEVLNDRFPLRFKQRGSMVEAVILATGLKPIPARYLHGMTVLFTLTFWDQFAIPIGVEDGLSVDRSTTPRQRVVPLST